MKLFLSELFCINKGMAVFLLLFGALMLFVIIAFLPNSITDHRMLLICIRIGTVGSFVISSSILFYDSWIASPNRNFQVTTVMDIPLHKVYVWGNGRHQMPMWKKGILDLVFSFLGILGLSIFFLIQVG